MEGRESQLDVAKVPIAGLVKFPTSLTLDMFFGQTQTPIKRSIGSNGSVLIKVIECLIAYLYHAPVDNILLGSSRVINSICLWKGD